MTKWTLEAVVRVLRRDIQISGLKLDEIYAVDDHGITGGPVLRGPWGSTSGSQGDWERYGKMCKDFLAAHVHGFLAARRQRCEERDYCSTGGVYCADCGGIVEPTQ